MIYETIDCRELKVKMIFFEMDDIVTTKNPNKNILLYKTNTHIHTQLTRNI